MEPNAPKRQAYDEQAPLDSRAWEVQLDMTDREHKESDWSYEVEQVMLKQKTTWIELEVQKTLNRASQKH